MSEYQYTTTEKDGLLIPKWAVDIDVGEIVTVRAPPLDNPVQAEIVGFCTTDTIHEGLPVVTAEDIMKGVESMDVEDIYTETFALEEDNVIHDYQTDRDEMFEGYLDLGVVLSDV